MMDWTRQRTDEQFLTRSTDGYYAIAWHIPDDTMHAYHVEALWATPTDIGHDRTLDGAKQICEQHRATTPSPTI